MTLRLTEEEQSAAGPRRRPARIGGGPPAATAFGEDAYPDLWTKAAALLQPLVKDHALIDGDERLGWLAGATSLEVNGVPMARAANDEVYGLVLRMAAGHDDVATIADGLRRLLP